MLIHDTPLLIVKNLNSGSIQKFKCANIWDPLKFIDIAAGYPSFALDNNENNLTSKNNLFTPPWIYIAHIGIQVPSL